MRNISTTELESQQEQEVIPLDMNDIEQVLGSDDIFGIQACDEFMGESVIDYDIELVKYEKF